MNKDLIEKNVQQLSHAWEVVDGRMITHAFELENFRDAMRFVNRVAQIGEQYDHHPDIYIEYNLVRIRLMTHEIGGLSEKDFLVAHAIEADFKENK
jgi:4a-hydroxytetrahydrobiopterin dehydratase